MKRGQALLLTAAAVSALGSAAVVHGLLTHAFPSDARLARNDTVQILIAVRNIAAGDSFEPAAATWQPWPSASVSPSMIALPAALEFTGAAASKYFARAPILAGEPIRRDRLVRRGDAGLLAALLTPGMRAVSLPLRDENGVAGLIRANDRVDVIVTRDRRANGAARGPGGSETILRGVRVLSADQPPEASARVGGFTKGPHQKTAALEVTPRQAELLAGARRMGDIFLSLAALGDVTPSDDGGKRLTPSSLTIIKFGVATKVATD